MCQAQNCTNHQSSTQAPEGDKKTLFVDGITKVNIANIESFQDLLTTSEKVANLTEADSVDSILTLSVATGALSAAVHSRTDENDSVALIGNGVAGALAAIFQLAAVEGIPLEFILEKTRDHIERDAQEAANVGVRNFFADRGLSAR